MTNRIGPVHVWHIQWKSGNTNNSFLQGKIDMMHFINGQIPPYTHHTKLFTI